MAGDLGASDEFLEELEDQEEDVAAEVATGGLPWAEAALAAVHRLLAAPGSEELALYSLRAMPSSRRLDVRIDKLTNPYGSPTLDEIESFTRGLNAELEAALGVEAAGEIEVEVSSPGAERQVRIPGELQRFAELPMRVEYDAAAAAAAAAAAGAGADSTSAAAAAAPTAKIEILEFLSQDEVAGVTRWRQADVRANRARGKGRGLSKRQREAVLDIPLAALRRVNLHLDV